MGGAMSIAGLVPAERVGAGPVAAQLGWRDEAVPEAGRSVPWNSLDDYDRALAAGGKVQRNS